METTIIHFKKEQNQDRSIYDIVLEDLDVPEAIREIVRMVRDNETMGLEEKMRSYCYYTSRECLIDFLNLHGDFSKKISQSILNVIEGQDKNVDQIVDSLVKIQKKYRFMYDLIVMLKLYEKNHEAYDKTKKK